MSRKGRLARLAVLVAALAVLSPIPSVTKADCTGWGWWEECGTPCDTAEIVCWTFCFYCPDTGQTTCGYSGHYCNRCDGQPGPCCPGNPWPQCGW